MATLSERLASGRGTLAIIGNRARLATAAEALELLRQGPSLVSLYDLALAWRHFEGLKLPPEPLTVKEIIAVTGWREGDAYAAVRDRLVRPSSLVPGKSRSGFQYRFNRMAVFNAAVIAALARAGVDGAGIRAAADLLHKLTQQETTTTAPAAA